MKPLLGLVMILKDEAARIAETFESVRGVVDHITVLDTGSTDGTQDIVREICTKLGLTCTLHEEKIEPFDFSVARNRVLDLADSTQFTLMLSGDEVLNNGAALRAFLKTAANDAYCVKVSSENSSFTYPRILASGSSWRYERPIHEQVVNRQHKRDGSSLAVIPSVLIEHRVSDPLRRFKRFREFDAPVLERLLKEQTSTVERNLTRIFLAQTYVSLASQEKADEPGGAYIEYLSRALALYMSRADAGGEPEERSYAHYQFLYLASVLNLYSDAEMIPRIAALANDPTAPPESHFRLAVHTAAVNPASGYAAAISSAKVARAAQVKPPRMPYDSSLLWRSHALAAACAKGGGKLDLMKKSAVAAVECGGPKAVLAEFLS